MLRFLNKVIKVTVFTVFFVVLGLDMMLYYLKQINLYPSFDYSQLNGLKYNVNSTIGPEKIEEITRHPIVVSLQVIFPELEKEKKNGNR